MLADRRGHFLGLAVGARVVAAHDPLEIRELAHHVGEEIALAELGGAQQRFDGAADGLGDRSAERAHAARLVAERAELRLEGHRIERRRARGEGLLAVLFPEEGGIGEARPHDALVALAHLRGVAALDVAHRDEGGQEAPGSILHREVTLVVRERRDQHFPRQREEALLEAPRERHRPLGERRHLIEERGGDERAAARVRRRGGDFGLDALAARRQIRQHMAALTERALVGSGAGDADRSRRVKAMTTREVAGRGVEERRGDHLASEQHHHPVHRAHEHRSALAPVHAARNGQRIEHLAHEVGQQINRALAGLRADEEEEFPFAFVELLERFDARPAALGEGERGARRLPSRTEGGGKGRSAALHVLLGLPRGEALRPHRQAPRGGKARELPVREARLVEPRGKSRHERLLERAQRPRRQLLGADLEEEVVTLTPYAALALHAAAPGAPPAAAARTGVAAFSSGNPSASRDSR